MMIRITRGHQYMDMLRAYKILIDDEYRGEIRIDETKEFPVEKGRHTIRAKIDWGGSPTRCVDVGDSPVDIEVGCSVVGRERLFIFAYLTFLRNEYLWLKVKKSNADEE